MALTQAEINEVMQQLQPIIAKALNGSTSIAQAQANIQQGVTQYIGARYVPLFADPIEWDNTRAYEPLTIVLYQGNSFTTRQYAPAGIEITNEEFWAETGNYNAQIELYRQEVEKLRKSWLSLDTLEDLIKSNPLEGSVCFVRGRWEYGKGSAFYKIVGNEIANGYDIIACDNGKFAKLVPLETVTPEQLEPKNATDYAPVLMYAIRYARENLLEFYAGGVYNTATPIVFTDDEINVRIDGTINYSGFGNAIDIRNRLSTYKFGTVLATNGNAIVLNQAENAYDSLVQAISVEYDRVVAKNDGVGLYAGNHGVLDVELKCNISNSAANCYHSIGGVSNDVSNPSYVGEIHVSGGRLKGSNFAINIEVKDGFECTGHKVHDLSAEDSSKLVNLDATKGQINNCVFSNIRIEEIKNAGMITARGNVRECEFYFSHFVATNTLDIQVTTASTRGIYIFAPIAVPGAEYANYNCLYFDSAGYKLLQQTAIKESGVSDGYSWDLSSTTPPVNFIVPNSDLDVSKLGYFTNNGIPLFVTLNSNGSVMNGSQVLLNKDSDALGTYALLRTTQEIKVLKLVK